MTIKSNYFSKWISQLSTRRTCGAVCLTVGVSLLFLKTWIIEFILNSFTLKPNSILGELWQKLPEPTTTDVYLFNWTNPEHFLNNSVKPKFQQMGPYRYLATVEKTHVVWNDNNTVTYRNKRTWQFNQKKSQGDLSDKVTTYDIINALTSHYIRDWNYFLKKTYTAYWKSIVNKYHVSTTVHQLVSEGYDDFLVHLYNYLPFIAPQIPRFDKFGLLFIRNASDDFEGVFNMGTGVNGQFEVYNWNYQNTTPYYHGKCAAVHGSGSELFSRKLKKEGVGVFAAELCRFMPFDFEKEVYVDGILGYKYLMEKSFLDNGTHNPENACSCNGDCIPHGMVNISSCRYGFPLYISLPNFLGADPVYLDGIDGLLPDRKEHESYIILEPITSTILEARITAQFNVLVHPIEDITMFEDIRRVFFPIVWAQQKGKLPDSLVFKLKLFLLLPHFIIGFSVLAIIAGILLQVNFNFKLKNKIIKPNIYQLNFKKESFSEDFPLNTEVLKHRESLCYKNALIV